MLIVSGEKSLMLVQGCSRFLHCYVFMVMVKNLTELGSDGVTNEMLYAENLALKSETIDKCQKVIVMVNIFRNKGFKIFLRKIKVMVSRGITKDWLGIDEVYLCWICSLSLKINSVMCVRCGKCICSRCAEVRRVCQWLK